MGRIYLISRPVTASTLPSAASIDRVLTWLLPRVGLGNLAKGFTLVREALAGYKRQLVLLVLLGFVSSFFEAIGINLLIPLFSAFSGAGGVGGDDLVTRAAMRAFSAMHVPFSVISKI